MGDQSVSVQPLGPHRDIFLSHRGLDNPFVNQLAADIEGQDFQARRLLAWVDEAEIRAGQSIPAMITLGLENSRFMGLVMTPVYFTSESGWTDAEWHAALHVDPDNRTGRIIPLLVADCPYIPYLLRHLKAIDFRGNRYDQGLRELLFVLRDEPLPRPTTHRGQLVTPNGRIDRATLFAERAVPQAYPDAITEKLYCNLLPVERVPQRVYIAPIAAALRKTRLDGTETLPTKQQLKRHIRSSQEALGVDHPFMPAFRTELDTVVTFHDLDAPDGALAPIIQEGEAVSVPTTSLLEDEADRRLVMSLLNMALSRHAHRVGLEIDDEKRGRFYFPPRNGGTSTITWTPLRKKSTRTVAKPCIRDKRVVFWVHQGAYLRMLFLAHKFYVQVTPTWVLTRDGHEVKRGPDVGPLVIKWTGKERNLSVLYHVRFWTSVLRRGPGPIAVRAGDQGMEIATVPAFVQQSYGIADDQRQIMSLLDQDAPLIEAAEEAAVEFAVGAEVEALEDANDEELGIDDLEEGDFDAE